MIRPASIKDKQAIEYIEYLENELKVYKESPLVDTYFAIQSQIKFWNSQLTDRQIDLFADKDSKEFDRAWKYLLEATDVLKKMDELRKLMTPKQKEETDKPKMVNGSVAEKYIFNTSGK